MAESNHIHGLNSEGESHTDNFGTTRCRVGLGGSGKGDVLLLDYFDTKTKTVLVGFITWEFCHFCGTSIVHSSVV